LSLKTPDPRGTSIIRTRASKIYGVAARWLRGDDLPAPNERYMPVEPQIHLGPFEFRPAAIRIEGRPKLEEWKGPLQFALWCQRASPWWIGDMINSGEDIFGEEFAAVLGGTLSTEMVSRYASVARRVPPRNRRPKLSWSAHAAVARLEDHLQRRMLALAEKEGWNSDDLQKQVRELVKTQGKSA